jgi:COMPASS component SWD3
MVSEKAPFAPYRLHRTLVGHAGSVAAVKFSPDGQWLATASADATCRLWRLSDGHCVATLAGHTGGLSDVCWSAGSDYVATGSDDKLLALWRVPTGERVLTYTGHTAFVFCCTFNPQSNLLASGSFDETVRLWEARTGRCLAVLPAHSDPVTSVAFSHDGTLLVSGSYDGACGAHVSFVFAVALLRRVERSLPLRPAPGLVRLWNPLDGACLQTLVQDDAPPVSCVRVRHLHMQPP